MWGLRQMGSDWGKVGVKGRRVWVAWEEDVGASGRMSPAHDRLLCVCWGVKRRFGLSLKCMYNNCPNLSVYILTGA